MTERGNDDMTHTGHAENLIEILQTQVGIKQQEIDALLDITRAINNNVSEASLIQIYDLTLQVHLRVRNIAVWFWDDGWNLAFQRKSKKEAEGIDVERDLLGYKDVTHLDREEPASAVLAAFDLVIPVYHKEEALAYVLMSHPFKESYEIMEEKVKFIQAFTNIVAVAIENRKLFRRQLEQEGMKKELEVAAQVQALLIPDRLPDDEQVQMAAVYLPHRNVGGDYYDYIRLGEEEFVFVMADISGKGTGAALLMANFQANVRALIKTASFNLREFVKQLNENVLRITRGEKFITMFLGRYNTASRRLTYVNCGHNPSILYTGGETSLLGDGCTILGMFDELPFVNVGTADVPPDSVIINYTDGVTDLTNEKGLNYSTDHLVHILQRNPGIDMPEFIKRAMGEIYEFKGEMEYVDDISLLAVRVF